MDSPNAALVELFSKWKNYHQDIDRPTWDDIMMGVATLVATRSHDAQTQCGSVLCNQDNEIIATGYNGFIRNIDDKVLPNVRDQKYALMLHSEINLIINCARQGKSTKDTTIYVTAHPCLQCLQYIWQAGIKKVIHGNQQTHMQQSQDSKLKSAAILYLTGLEIEEYVPKIPPV